MVLMQRDLDSIGAQTLGLDPIIVLGLSTMGFAAAGWLVGPFFGNAVFNLVNRGVRGQIDAVSWGVFLLSFWVLGEGGGGGMTYGKWKDEGWCLRVFNFFFLAGFLLMCMVWICRKNALSMPASRNIESTRRRRQWRILSRITMERRSAAWRIIGGG